MGCGSIPNRDRASTSYEIKYSQMAMPTDVHFADHLISIGGMRRGNKCWERPQYRATAELIRDLEAMFLGGKSTENDKTSRISKFTAAEAVARLANMTDIQGRRKYRKSNELTGPLPTEIFVRGKFSQMKSSGIKGLVEEHERMKDAGDFQSMNIFQKCECFHEFFKQECTELNLKQKLLEVDDKLRGIDFHSEEDTILDIDEINNELMDRGIKYEQDKALNMILSLHTAASSKQFLTFKFCGKPVCNTSKH